MLVAVLGAGAVSWVDMLKLKDEDGVRDFLNLGDIP